MKRSKMTRKLFVLMMAAMPFLLPAAVLAEEAGGGAASGAGAAITLSLLGLVFLIIVAVAVVSAVGLGIIGLGYWMSQGGD